MSSFSVALKVSTVSEKKLIGKPVQVSDDGMSLALIGRGRGSSLVHKDYSSTPYSTKRLRVKQPQKTMSASQGREVLESCVSLPFY